MKYDSVLGPLPETVTADADSITIGGKKIKVFATKDPAQLDWNSLGAQIVVEIHGLLHRRQRCRQAPARLGEEGHHLGSGEE